METLRINNKKYDIKYLSELTFEEFDKIMVDGEVSNLPEYLACFTDISIKDLLDGQVRGTSLPALHQRIFNVDIEDVIKDKKDTLKFKDEIYSVDSLRHDTFGKHYHFELYHSVYSQKKFSFYRLCIYALAVALTDEMDAKKINEAANRLMRRKWVEVLPQGFFFVKKLSRSKRRSISLWAACTILSKKIKWKIKYSRKLLIQWEKI